MKIKFKYWFEDNRWHGKFILADNNEIYCDPQTLKTALKTQAKKIYDSLIKTKPAETEIEITKKTDLDKIK